MDSFSRITFQIDQRTARLVLNQPPLNILSAEMFDEISAAIDRLQASPEVSVLLITGAGPKAFCAGVEVGIHRPNVAYVMLNKFHSVMRRLLNLSCLSIAGVHGHALGGGCEVAICCDYVIATENARFGQPEINVGCFPPIAAALCPNVMGAKRALDFIAGGEPLSARQALECGLVTRVVPDGELESSLAALVEQLSTKSAAVLRLTRKAVLMEEHEAFMAALARRESLYLDQLVKLADAAEGIEAFIEKRKPNWQHR